jgi:hypothetical protein
VVAARHGEAVVLLDVKCGRFYILNVVAGAVWDCVTRHMDRSEIAASIRRMFVDAPTSVEEDISGALERLAELGLLTAE